MSQVISVLRGKLLPATVFFVFLILSIAATGQMRQIFVDNQDEYNHVKGISFYSPSEGYVAFEKWIGYTTDSGRTFTRKYIGLNNVNYNGYPVNLTFGFGIGGVKAFNQNKIIVYGDYGFVPSILYSIDGGNTYTLIYQSYFNPYNLTLGTRDLAFPSNGNIGYAVEADYIIKSVNGGLNWSPSIYAPNSFFDCVEAVNDNVVYAYTANETVSKMMKTTNGGTGWQQVNLPPGKLFSASFISGTKGWICMDFYKIYYTQDGGLTWTKKNDETLDDGVFAFKIKFVNDSTGYALGGGPTVMRTVDSGSLWEPLPRDNNYEYGHKQIFPWSQTQIWAGGEHGFLELTTNGGGTTLPVAIFKIDTTGLSTTHTVNLLNHSITGNQYKWFKNDTLIATSYNASYVHNINVQSDTIKLVVVKGSNTDTAEHIQYFIVPPPPPVPTISSFTPVSGSPGTIVTINGTNFNGSTAVSFGGVPASSFTIVSSTKITAIVGTGATGDVAITNSFGTGSHIGFTFIPLPKILSFTPISGDVGTVVTISGLYLQDVTAVSFGGIAASSFTITSPNSITAIVATGGTGNVKVTSPSGSSSVPEFTFTPHQPIITSFFPASGSPGTVVTIVGNNFSSTPGNNIVYFGAVKAAVNSAANTVLTVTVPIGSTYEPISVTTNSLTAYTNTPFNITFSGNGTIDSNSFAAKQDFAAGEFPYELSLVDIDGDGKADVSASNFNTSNLTILRNTSTIGAIGFPAYQNFSVGDYLRRTTYGDVDGDGKKDIIAADYPFHKLSVSKNTSVPGTISFGSRSDYATRTYPWHTAIGDLDGDGKPDIVVANEGNGEDFSHMLSVLRNTTIGNNISFAPKLDFVSGSVPLRIAITDIDGDGKPEIISSNGGGDNPVSIFKNTSSVANINFAPAINTAYGTGSINFCTGDIDGDGKTDVILVSYSYGTSKVTVLRNTSSIGSISFAAPLIFPGNPHLTAVAVADVDGDLKPEVIATSEDSNSVSVYKNVSSPGSIMLNTNVDFKTGVNPHYSLGVGDIDGDGKPEIVTGLGGTGFPNTISILRNTVPIGPTNVQICEAGGGSLQSGLSGSSFQWQQNTGSGFVDINDNANFSGTHTALLQLSNIPVSWDGYQYRCVSNTGTSNTFVIKIKTPTGPAVTISTSTTSVCAGSAVTFSATSPNLGQNVSYQWQVDGVNTGPNSNTFTYYSPGNNFQMKVIMTTDAACLITNSATSNTLSMTVGIPAHPSVYIESSGSSVCSGSAVHFIAVASDAGSSPIYLWRVNGVDMGTNSALFSIPSVTAFSQVEVRLTNNDLCASPHTTNFITSVNVLPSVTPSVSISTPSTTVCPGATVTFTASTVNGGSAPTYQWKKNGANVGSNSSVYTTNSIATGEVISLTMTSDFPCVTTPTANSNNITMTISGTNVTPAVSIVASGNPVCANQQVTFTATPTNGGPAPSYQWERNGLFVGTNSNVYTNSQWNNNDVVKVTMTSNAQCVNPATATSNAVALTVSGSVSPSINLTGLTTVNQNQLTLITANTTNAGTSPSYQWYDSTSLHGWQVITGANAGNLSYTPGKTGDRLRCVVTSSVACANPQAAVSASLTFTVNTVTWVEPVPSSDYGIIYYPNPVGKTLVVDSLKPLDRWDMLEIYSVDGKQKIISARISNQSRVNIPVGKLPGGVYVAVLRRKTGNPIYFKFVKL